MFIFDLLGFMSTSDFIMRMAVLRSHVDVAFDGRLMG